MALVHEILEFNEQFVQDREFEKYLTDRMPNKNLAILTCMDTRLVELLTKSLDLRNGDAKIIKNAGAILTHPFGSAMRSILVSIYELGVQEVFVIGHHGCGMAKLDSDALVNKIKARGIPDNVFDTLENSGIKLDRFFKGFDRAEDNVEHSVEMIRKHPLMPEGIPVHGFVIHPETGKLDWIVNGYDEAHA
jgi:carbonic anhydrase